MHIFATRQCIKISVSFLSTIHQGKNMPKNACQGRSSKEKKEASNKNDKCELKRAVFLTPKNEIYIKIHAKPGAKQNAITDICDEAVGIQIAAPPIDGEANKELIRFLAEVLQLKKSEIYLEKGSKSREKTVVVSGLATTVDSVLSKFQFANK